MSIIGQRIKEKRIAKGLTQEELGDLLGVKKAAVQKYENGTIINLKADTIRTLCKVLDFMPYELIWDDDEGAVDEIILNRLHVRPDLKRKILQSELETVGVEMIRIFDSLNKLAKIKVVEYAYDLSKIAEYKNSGSR